MAKGRWYQAVVQLLVAVALALFSGIPFMPQAAASPNQMTFYSTASDGTVWAEGFNYSAVHGAPSWGVYLGYEWLAVGQQSSALSVSHFELYRGALFFDTSSLPDDAIMSSAVLSLYGDYDGSNVDFDITVVGGLGLHEPLNITDYHTLMLKTESGGSFNTSGFSTSGYNDIPLNETGRGWISKTATTKLGLRSSRDIVPTEPPSLEVVQVYASEKGEGFKPRLVVTYSTPPTPRVPSLSQWGMVALISLFAGLLVWTVRRRRPAL